MGRAAIPCLLEVLDNPDYVRKDVMVALGRCRPTTKEAVSVLIQLLRDDDLAIREASLLALDGLLFNPEPEVMTVVPAALKRFLDQESHPKLYARAWRMLEELEDWIEYDATKAKETQQQEQDSEKTR